MKTFKSIFIFGAISACAVSFTSCDDDEKYDIDGTTDNFVFHPDKSGSFKVIKTPLSTISSMAVEIPAQCTRKASSYIKISFDIDNSLIDVYNDVHGTSYTAAPDGLVVIDNNGIVIPKGEMKTSEPINIHITDDKTICGQIADGDTYLVPIRRVSVDGGKAIPSVDINPVTYLTLSVTEDNIKHGATASDAKGTLVSDQTGWSGTFNGNTSDQFATLFDGNTTTVANFSARTDISLEFDMGQSYTFDAITMYYTQDTGWWGVYTYGSLTSDVKIYTSNDGVNWKSVGNYENGDSDQIVIFYSPITARYIRLIKPCGYYVTLYGGIFNVYAL